MSHHGEKYVVGFCQAQRLNRRFDAFPIISIGLPEVAKAALDYVIPAHAGELTRNRAGLLRMDEVWKLQGIANKEDRRVGSKLLFEGGGGTNIPETATGRCPLW